MTEEVKKKKKLRVAIVGSGIAGLSATWLIGQRHSVTLFERADRLGMDAAGFNLPEGRRVDMPPRACSRSYYPNLTALYDAAGVKLAPFSWAFCYTDAADPSGKPYFRVDGGSTTEKSSTVCGFRLPRMNGLTGWLRLLRFSNVKMFFDAIRFHTAIRRDVTRTDVWEQRTLREYLDEGGYSDAFINGGLLPILSMVCTCSYENVLRYPAGVIMRYLVVSSSHQQFRTKDGTQNAARTLAAAAEKVHLSVRVERVSPGDDASGKKPSVSYRRRESTKVRTEKFDIVVVAAPANVAARLIASTQDLTTALETFEHETSKVLLHRNPVVMPRERADWAAMAMLCDSSKSSDCDGRGRVMFSMYASHKDVLALDESEYGPLFMTWNPFPNVLSSSTTTKGSASKGAYPGVATHNEQVDDSMILSQVVFERPLMTIASKSAVETVWRAQGRDGIYIVGAYTLFDVPLQENAVASAVAVASRIEGVNIPFSPSRKAHSRSVRKRASEAEVSSHSQRPRFAEAMAMLLLFALGLTLCLPTPPWEHAPLVSSILNGDHGAPPILEIARDGIRALVSDSTVADYLRVAAYFSSLGIAVAVAMFSWPWMRALSSSPAHVLAPTCAIIAWVVTWRLIMAFFVEYANTYADEVGPNMFVEAYVMVSDDPIGWLWSSQLLLWVSPAVVFVYVESKRLGVSGSVSMSWILAAFLGAVSLGFPLALSHLDLMRRQRKEDPTHDKKRVTISSTELAILALCVTLALGSVHMMPTYLEHDRKSYVLALGILHVILIVPFVIRGVFCDEAKKREVSPLPSFSLSTKHAVSRFGLGTLYLLICVICVAVHRANVATAASKNPALTRGQLEDVAYASVWSEAAWRNSCQSSIDFDVVFTALTTATMIISSIVHHSGAATTKSALLLAMLAAAAFYAVPRLSLAAFFTSFCAAREFIATA